MFSLFDPFTLAFKEVSFFKKLKRYFYTPINQFSAGVVIFKRTKTGPKVFLLQRGGVWNDYTFPKGRVESGETANAAAIREALEETGMQVELMKTLTPNLYTFYADEKRQKIHKSVQYFLAETNSTKVRFDLDPSDSPEHGFLIGYNWVSFSKAKSLVKHAIEKQLLDEAQLAI